MAKAVIMAGGQGERFWPMTHEQFPKYRIPFYGNKSLLQKTLQRLEKVYGKGNVYVITTAGHTSFIRKELPRLSKKNILIEPSRKNTAAAIYLATLLLEKQFGTNEVISFYPADHLIQNEKLFRATIQNAIRLATRRDDLVTIGIQPTFPAIGYGYIESGKILSGFKNAFCVKRFVEKPDYPTAVKYGKKNNFFWNGGIFTWKTGVLLAAMRRHSPDIAKTIVLDRLKAGYKKVKSISIDYALFEKAENISMIRTSMDWCDVGSWDMYHAKNPQDASGNYVDGLSVQHETRNSLLLNHTSKPLVALGLSDILVVQTPQGTLVCRRGRAEEGALLFKKL